MGRTATGVKGITLSGPKDEVVGMICIDRPEEETVLVVSAKGYGKRTYLNDPEDGEAVYRITNRGGKGVKTLNITDKTGELIAIKSVSNEHDLMIINKSGIAIRMVVENMRVMGRATQGVKLINLKGKDQIAAVAKVPTSKDEEEVSDGEDGPNEGESSEGNSASNTNNE
jgi:DNA gyrase subunit A